MCVLEGERFEALHAGRTTHAYTQKMANILYQQVKYNLGSQVRAHTGCIAGGEDGTRVKVCACNVRFLIESQAGVEKNKMQSRECL